MTSRWGGEPLPLWMEVLLAFICIFVLWVLVTGWPFNAVP